MKMKMMDHILQAFSTWMDWIPFCMLAEIAIFDLYACDFGECQSLIACSFMVYLVVVLSLKFKLYKTEERLQSKLNALRDCKLDHLNAAERAHSFFPNTTRILNALDFSILFIGTSHYSHASAVQSAEIIKTLRPNAIILELDEKRAKTMNLMDSNHSMHSKQLNLVLIRDLFKMETYSDPITLMMRISTRCANYFFFAGNEFKMAALAAPTHCRLVFGDQDVSKTIESIKNATPFWIMILLNICFVILYGIGSMSSFFRVIGHLSFCLYHHHYSVLLQKIMISMLCWSALAIFAKLALQTFIEATKRKNGVNGVNQMLSIIGSLCPCLAKIFKASHLKHTRNIILATNTLKAAADLHHPLHHKLLVAVIGIAHLDDVHLIAKQKVKAQDAASNAADSRQI